MKPPPQRGAKHDALDCFRGIWTAVGTSYGGTDQSGDPTAHGERWLSTHTASWHTGSFFLLQNERASIAGKAFDTFSVIGVDSDSGEYFVRSFENHGFYRNYALACAGFVWTLSGATERARIEFVDDRRTQRISWEWKPDQSWLPLCERIATRID